MSDQLISTIEVLTEKLKSMEKQVNDLTRKIDDYSRFHIEDSSLLCEICNHGYKKLFKGHLWNWGAKGVCKECRDWMIEYLERFCSYAWRKR